MLEIPASVFFVRKFNRKESKEGAESAEPVFKQTSHICKKQKLSAYFAKTLSGLCG